MIDEELLLKKMLEIKQTQLHAARQKVADLTKAIKVVKRSLSSLKKIS